MRNAATNPRWALSMVALATGLGATQAWAQDAVAADGSDDSASEVPEIIVTATKREQSLQQVPIAVSVTTAETIQRAHITDLKDLQSVVPSLKVTQLQSSSQTNFIIRGFGNGANSIGVEPSVGVFIDGVYRSRSGASISDLPDVQRVEVLRGPQSTLFGKNASVGVISITTQEPKFDFGGRFDATYGNYNQILLKGVVTGPIVADKLAVSLAATYNQRDGYITNLARSEKLNDRDRWSLRGQMLFEPSDNVKLRLIADYDQLNEICCGAPNVISATAPTTAIRAIGGNLNPANPFAYKVYTDQLAYNKLKNYGVSLQSDVGLDGVKLTSILSYRHFQENGNTDADFSSAKIVGYNTRHSKFDTYTAELRLASDTKGGLIDWMVGGYLFHEKLFKDSAISWGTDARPYFNARLGAGTWAFLESTYGLPSGSVFGAGQYNYEVSGQKNTAVSMFGQVDLHATDALTLTGGINYTHDDKATNYAQLVNNKVFDRVVLTGPFVAVRSLQLFPPLISWPNSVISGKTNDGKVTWTARAAYKFNSNVNAYVSAATGFKATSWNLTSDARPFASMASAIVAAGLAQPNQAYGTLYARPESTIVYEAGFKGRWPGFAFNAAVFYEDIKNFQTTVFTGTGFAFSNAEKESTRGFEFDAQVTPTKGLNFNFAGTILDPEYDKFKNGQTVSLVNGVWSTGTADLSGKTPAGMPKISLSLGASYDFSLSDSLDGFARVDYQFQSKNQLVDNTPAFLGTGVSTINGSFGLRTASDWGIEVWARNLFNDHYLISAFPAPAQTGNFDGYPSTPRTYGVTINKRF